MSVEPCLTSKYLKKKCVSLKNYKLHYKLILKIKKTMKCKIAEKKYTIDSLNKVTNDQIII